MVDPTPDRRALLGATGAMTLSLLAGCLGGGGGDGDDTDDQPDERPPETVAIDWVTASVPDAGHPGAANVEGPADIADRTGQAEVVVENGNRVSGLFVFEPAIVTIEPGTTITWQWTSSAHSVTPLEAFGATITDWEGTGDQTFGQGHTHAESFDSPGVGLYYCIPHLSQGQTGAIVVVE